MNITPEEWKLVNEEIERNAVYKQIAAEIREKTYNGGIDVNVHASSLTADDPTIEIINKDTNQKIEFNILQIIRLNLMLSNLLIERDMALYCENLNKK